MELQTFPSRVDVRVLWRSSVHCRTCTTGLCAAVDSLANTVLLLFSLQRLLMYLAPMTLPTTLFNWQSRGLSPPFLSLAKYSLQVASYRTQASHLCSRVLSNYCFSDLLGSWVWVLGRDFHNPWCLLLQAGASSKLQLPGPTPSLSFRCHEAGSSQ
jgi:hypothetical protein